jgi:hypothetical protein
MIYYLDVQLPEEDEEEKVPFLFELQGYVFSSNTTQLGMTRAGT